MPFWKRRLPTPGPRQPAETPPSDVLERVRAIEIKARRLVNDRFLGEYNAVFRGRGVEFDELRPYIPGDDVRDIDWKTLARSGQPFIRRYREERDLTVIFLVDVSASQVAGALPQSKAELAAEICAVLSIAAIRSKDRVGLLLFASEPERFVPPAGGSTHVLRVVREVLGARPRSRGTSIGAALAYITSLQRRRATIFLLSDFLTTDYATELRAASRRHDVIAVRIRESIDATLEDVGLARLTDAETGRALDVDTSSPAVREAYARAIAIADEERTRLFGTLAIDEIPVTVGQDYVPALLRFFKRRAISAA